MIKKSQEHGERSKDEGADQLKMQSAKFKIAGSRLGEPGPDNPARGIELHTPMRDFVVQLEREKFSRDIRQFGWKGLIGRRLIARLCKWRGFRGLRLFFTGFHRFFMVFSRDFHAEVRWFSWVVEKQRVFLFFYRGEFYHR
jgi:hypothetical protein